MKLGLQTVPIKALQHKGWMRSEMRVKLNSNKVQQYAAEKKKGAQFPAPVVFFDHDEVFWTGDGFHRIAAEESRGNKSIDVFLKTGSLRDAILFNLHANRESQGLPFGPGDITKAIKTLLTDKAFSGWTRTKVAQVVGCSVGMVSRTAIQNGFPRAPTGQRLVAQPEEVAQMLADGMTHEEVAKKLGVGVRTTYRREISSRFGPCPHCHGSGRVLIKKAS